jgi:hypothetical protein
MAGTAFQPPLQTLVVNELRNELKKVRHQARSESTYTSRKVKLKIQLCRYVLHMDENIIPQEHKIILNK